MLRAIASIAVVAVALTASAFAGVHHPHTDGTAHEPTRQSDALAFRQWMAQYRPSGYASAAEFALRFDAFRATRARVAAKEARRLRDGAGAVHALNDFSDWTSDEFKRLLTFRAPSSAAELPALPAARHRPHAHSSVEATEAFDWREHGAVSYVKDQGQCGSCWAFSAVETVESFWFLSNGTLPILSPQQVVDCNIAIPDMGCNGGTTQFAYEYMMKVGGLDSEAEYPYTSGDDGQRGFCLFDPKGVQAKVKGWAYATPVCADLSCNTQNEQTMADALVSNGPVSVCLNANAWDSYSSGVMDGTDCGGHGLLDLDHCVQTVGFNKTAPVPYWIVRNSWNTQWGIEGYIYLAMGNNTCGVANIATQVTVEPLAQSQRPIV